MSPKTCTSGGIKAFFAFKEIGRVFGAAALQTLIFKRGPKDVIIEFKLRVQEGD